MTRRFYLTKLGLWVQFKDVDGVDSGRQTKYYNQNVFFLQYLKTVKKLQIERDQGDWERLESPDAKMEVS